MKLKFKVAVIMQRTIPSVDGTSVDQLTLIKLSPVGMPAGDVLLAFADAKIDWHPVVYDEVDRNRQIIKKETLIQTAKVVQDGKPFTFEHDKVYTLDVVAAE